jgi:colicin import membrane protein
VQQGKKIATQAAYEPVKYEPLMDYFERNPQGTMLEKEVEDRLRKETAAKKAELARKELRKLQEEEAAAAEEKQNAMTGLDYESRTSVAKYQAGRAEIDRTEEAEAGRAARAEQDAREAAQGRAGGAATAAQRRYQQEQRSVLTQRQAQLQNRQSEIESALPGARVDDLRSAAAAGDKARGAANAAVASMMKALQDVTQQLETVNDKLNNLPK